MPPAAKRPRAPSVGLATEARPARSPRRGPFDSRIAAIKAASRSGSPRSPGLVHQACQCRFAQILGDADPQLRALASRGHSQRSEPNRTVVWCIRRVTTPGRVAGIQPSASRRLAARDSPRANEAMSAQGSPLERRRRSTLSPSSGRSAASSRTARPTRSGWPRARPAAAGPRRAARPSGRRRCASRRRGCARRARALRNSVVSSSGWRAASSSAAGAPNGLTSSKVARRRSGVHTWMPFEPVTWANGSSPISRSRSPVAARRAADGGEVRAGRRVEVEHEPVGLAQLVGARQPDVRRDRVLADEVDELRRRSSRRAWVTVPPRLSDLDSLDRSSGSGPGVFFWKKPSAVDPVGVAHQAQRPVAHVGEHPLGDLLVVVGDVGLGEPVGREQQLVGAGDRRRSRGPLPDDLARPPCRRAGRGSAGGAGGRRGSTP